MLRHTSKLAIAMSIFFAVLDQSATQVIQKLESISPCLMDEYANDLSYPEAFAVNSNMNSHILGHLVMVAISQNTNTTESQVVVGH